MISNGTLTYASTPPPLDLHSPTTTPLHSILLALVTMFISYQATATILDLTLGLKPYGAASAAAMQTLHLFHTGSPLAAFRALFPHASAPSCVRPQFTETNDPHQQVWKPLPVIRLLFLLSLAPLVNIAAIVAMLEHSGTLTVAEAQFGGVAVGINRNLSTLNEDTLEKITNNTWRARVQTPHTDRVLVDFIIERLEQDIAVGIPGSAYVEVGFPREAEVFLRVKTPVGGMVSRTLAWAVFSEGPGSGVNYYIRNGMTNETAGILADAGIAMLAEWCGTDAGEGREIVAASPPPWLNIQTGRMLTCEREFGAELDVVKNMTAELSRKVTFVESEGLDIAARDDLVAGDSTGSYDGVFSQANEYWFVRRRTKYVSFLGLAVVLGVLVSARLIVGWFTRNDIAQGNELMIRKLLGLPWGDSMLGCDEVEIRYGKYGHQVEVVLDVLEGVQSGKEQWG